MFILAASALVVLALAFCWPLWRGQKFEEIEDSEDSEGKVSAIEADVDGDNAALYQDFVLELEADRTLDEDARAALLADKARQLLDDSHQSPSDISRGVSKGLYRGLHPALKVLIACVVVFGSALTYLAIGTPAADELANARDVLTLPALIEVDNNQNDPAIVELRAHTNRLRAYTERTPEEASSWYLLGIGELKLQSFTAAADAFEVAHGLVGDDANLDLYWLQARILADQGRLSEDSQRIAARVLQTQPNQPVVLNMLALAAFRSANFAAAVRYLNSALSTELAEGQRERLVSGFDLARQSLGIKGPTFDVELTLDGDPPAGAVLFVIARPVGGGIPYAVVRRPVSGVPDQVRLDDAVSMNPANPLSGAQAVEIIARLSLTGRPQAGPGDWQWQSPALSLAEIQPPVVLQAKLVKPGPN